MRSESPAVAAYRGETIDLEFLVTDPELSNAPVDLTTVSNIEWQVKARPGDPDPALLALSLSEGGIILRPQTGPTRGKCVVALSSAQTAALPAGRLYFDLKLFRGSDVKIVYPPTIITLRDAVNTP